MLSGDGRDDDETVQDALVLQDARDLMPFRAVEHDAGLPRQPARCR
jgi:hypothetical protein